MRIASFTRDGREQYGTVHGEQIIPAGKAFLDVYPDLRAVLKGGVVNELDAHCEPDHAFGLTQCTFLPTIVQPQKIFCVGANYQEHQDEMGHKEAQNPLLFVRFWDSQVGHGSTVIKPSVSEQLDYEGELALIIGREGQNIPEENALQHVAGYTCFNDLTVRDWQRHSSQFTAGKNFRGVGSMGPWMVTPDEAKVGRNTTLETRVDGALVQSSRVGNMIFSMERLISYISSFTVLRPGDVISTGTPGGVGAKRSPPTWLKRGQTVEVTVSGVGTLDNEIG
jgi:2-keto-4-pentenoate hydratase/2-oxohepta-3-ene-1,7-dioic acid hydratase in catechol pathway